MSSFELLNKAKKYLIKKEYEKAEEILYSLLIQKDLNIGKYTHKYLGEIYDKGKEDYLTAIKHYKELLNYDLTDKELVETNYIIGELITLSTDYLDPIKEQKKIEMLEKEAIQYFEKALDKRFNEYFIEASIQLAICYFTLDKFLVSIEILNNLLTLDISRDKLREVNDIMGACYFGLEEYDKALIYFKKIKANIVDNNLCKSRFLLGHIYYFKEKVIEVIKEELEVIYYENVNSKVNTNYKEDAYLLIKDTINNRLSGQLKVELINTIEMDIKMKNKLYKTFKKMGNIFLKYISFCYALQSYKITAILYFEEKREK